jgi:predicted protein tyrosine phosphatase
MDMVATNMRKMPHKHWHLISISCPDTLTKTNSFINDKTREVLKFQGCKKILPLQFDDIREDQVERCLKIGFTPVLFSKNNANQVIDFLKDLQNEIDNSDLVIHCDAGISRSGAIASFTSSYLKIPFFDPDIVPNKYILQVLWEVIDERKTNSRCKDFILV